MKLLLTTDTIGGVWTYTLDLARALAPHDVRIALATMGGPLSADQRRQVQELDNVSLFESQYKLEWMPDPWPDVDAAGQWLLEIEQRFCPDIVHLNGYAHGSLDWNAPALVVAHSCVLSWWQAVKGEPAPPEWNEYRRRVCEGIAAASHVVAPTATMLAAIEQYYGPFPPSRVIPNARNASKFWCGAKEPMVLSAGRLWDEAKNVLGLERIASKLSWPVHVAGEGGDGLAHGITWLGRLDQSSMAQALSRAAIYALPARYEPFGLSVLEAALSGCALVLGDIPSLRENWSGAAQFVEPDNHEQLLAAINHLIADPHARQALADAALRRARPFTMEKMASDYLAIYQEIMRFGSSPLPASLAARMEPVRQQGLLERTSACGS